MSAVTAKNFGNSFADWVREATVTLGATIVVLMATGIYIHFKVLFDLCKRAHQVRRVSAVNRRQALQTQVAPHNHPVHGQKGPVGHTPIFNQPTTTQEPSQPSNTVSCIAHERVTTTQEPSQPSNTVSCIAHERVTTTQEPSQPSNTVSCIAHGTVTTTQEPSQPSNTVSCIAHEAVTTTQDPTETTPLISRDK